MPNLNDTSLPTDSGAQRHLPQVDVLPLVANSNDLPRRLGTVTDLQSQRTLLADVLHRESAAVVRNGAAERLVAAIGTLLHQQIRRAIPPAAGAAGATLEVEVALLHHDRKLR